MKRFIQLLCIIGFSLFATGIPFTVIHVPQAAQEIPSYAKWGQVAMERTNEKYPQAEITDYLYIGREQGPEVSTEKFKLWLITANREFGVFVDITFKNDTEQITEIQFKETTRGTSSHTPVLSPSA